MDHCGEEKNLKELMPLIKAKLFTGLALINKMIEVYIIVFNELQGIQFMSLICISLDAQVCGSATHNCGINSLRIDTL